mmetsp:Transcript_17062/g.26627  ORF Transcript_17062/g.26627 Transcript_17062/m.26627 type:complete len:468 (+) Transcript_17062:2282-3685(+)
MGSSASTLSDDIFKSLLKDMTAETKGLIISEIVKKCNEILVDNPGNRCAKYAAEYLSSEEGKSLSNEDAQIFFKCICTGIENPDSSLGCYAMTPTDYHKFGGFFDKLIRDYHGDETGAKKHVTDWSAANANYDVKKLGQDELSMRVRVGRNLVGFNLPGKMDKQERINFEKRMLPAFDQLTEIYGGKVYSLTPYFGDDEENPNLISESKYKELVDAHVMFKDMAADSYLKSAGIANDWPCGRGCWQSEDKMRIIWFGEEDQLRIMCMKKGSDLLEVFTNLNKMLNTVESIEGIEFAKDDNYGYVTSCPSNLGTGMRASVHVKIPNLTSDGTDKKAKEVCKPLGLSVRGTGGEHTPIGADGTVDISPSARLFIRESEIIGKLYEGIEKLMAIENQSPIIIKEVPKSPIEKTNEESVSPTVAESGKTKNEQAASESTPEHTPKYDQLSPTPVLAITAGKETIVAPPFEA